jgi:hypothetical protein
MARYDVRVDRQASVPVAVIRRQARPPELSRLVPECCGLVWNAVRAQQVKAGRHVAIYWDGSIRLEVGVELFGPFTERDDVVVSSTPAGLTAWTTHFGPCAAHGHRLAGPSWEIYGHWIDAWNADPSQIRTDVFHQVAER